MDKVVYFIEGSLGIKIGCSSNLKSRLNRLRAEYGGDLNILGMIEGDFELEAELHRRFAPYPVHKREWFAKHPDIYTHIQEHAAADLKPYLHDKYVSVNISYQTYRRLDFLERITGNSISEIIDQLVSEGYPNLEELTDHYWGFLRSVDPGKRRTGHNYPAEKS